MTEGNGAAPNSALFARKGQATPAPAVGYVSVRVLQGKPERRSEESPFDGTNRRRSTFDRLFGKPSQAPPTPEVQPKAPDADETAPEQEPGIRSPLSSLIQRHGAAPAPRPAPEARGARLPKPRAARPQAPAESGTLQLGLSTPEREVSPPQPAPAAGRGKRHQLTLRLYPEDYLRFKALTERTSRTKQDVLAAAVIAYLD